MLPRHTHSKHGFCPTDIDLSKYRPSNTHSKYKTGTKFTTFHRIPTEPTSMTLGKCLVSMKVPLICGVYGMRLVVNSNINQVLNWYIYTGPDYTGPALASSPV